MKLTKQKQKEWKLKIDEQIDDCLERANSAKEVAEVMELISKRQILVKNKKRIDPNTIAVVAGNLLGLGLIINYERLHPITTKALGFVIRGRV